MFGAYVTHHLLIEDVDEQTDRTPPSVSQIDRQDMKVRRDGETILYYKKASLCLRHVETLIY